MWAAGTALAATLERWWFPQAWNETQLLASRFYYGDTPAFMSYAAALSAGEPFDNGIPFHPPGWPLFLSLLFRFAGWSADAPPDPLTLKHLNAVLSGLSVGLAALVAHAVAGRTAMIVASVLGIFHFGHLVQAAAPNSEPLYGLLVMAVIAGAIHTRFNAVGLGVAAGLTTIVRGEFALCAMLLAIWIAIDRTGTRDVRRAGLFLLGFLVALAPTTVMNWRSIQSFNETRAGRMPGPLPRFAPVTSYGAFNFANANHERADGGFNWDLPALTTNDTGAAAGLDEAQLDLARPAVYRVYVDGYELGLRWIASDPAGALGLAARKIAITLGVFDYGYLVDNVPVRLRGTRRPVDQIDLGWSWVTTAHLALTIAGAWFALVSAPSRVLLLPMATLIVSCVLFFGYVRLGVAYLPVIWILQAIGVVRLLTLVRWRPASPRGAEFAVAGLVLLLLLVEGARVDRPRALSVDGLADDSGELVEDQRMELERVR